MQGISMKSAGPSGPLSSSSAAPNAVGVPGEELSAWLDGELDPEAAQPLLDGLLRRDAGRAQFDEWCLVGDALRSHEVAAGHSPQLCARIAKAIESEATLLAPRALAGTRHRSSALARHIASGAAIAAAAAVVVLVAVPQLRGSLSTAPTQLAGAASPGSSAPVALVVPTGANSGANGGTNSATNRNPRLDPYIEAHRDFSGAGIMPAAAVYLRFGNEGDR